MRWNNERKKTSSYFCFSSSLGESWHNDLLLFPCYFSATLIDHFMTQRTRELLVNFGLWMSLAQITNYVYHPYQMLMWCESWLWNHFRCLEIFIPSEFAWIFWRHCYKMTIARSCQPSRVYHWTKRTISGISTILFVASDESDLSQENSFEVLPISAASNFCA